MNYIRVYESMLKQAAQPNTNEKARGGISPSIPGKPVTTKKPESIPAKQPATPDIARVDNTRVYTNPSSVPGGAAYTDRAPDAKDKLLDNFIKGLNASGDNLDRIGKKQWMVSRRADNILDWDFGNGQTATIDYTKLPDHYYGLQLLLPSFMASKQRRLTDASGKQKFPAYDKLDEETRRELEEQANNYDINLYAQPYTEEQLLNMRAGDKDYVNKLFAHLNSIAKKDLTAGNLRFSGKKERDAFRKLKPGVVDRSLFINGPDNYAAYSPYDGFIHFHNSDAQFEHRLFKDMMPAEGKVIPIASIGLPYSPHIAQTWPGFVGATADHENGHLLTLGNFETDPETGTVTSKPYDPNKPVSPTNQPAVLHLINVDPFSQTEKQFKWTGDQATEPYAMNEIEMIQALLGLNRGWFALVQNMKKEPNNPNYAKIDPAVLKQFKSFSAFTPAGQKGREQFDNKMQFLIANPQFQVMIPGASRIVDYYQSLKAAVDTATLEEKNATSPEEKAEAIEKREYFQNLMNKMIYSKVYLADKQNKARPTYSDALGLLA